MKIKKEEVTPITPEQSGNFKLTRGKIKSMYRDDISLSRNVDKQKSAGTSIGTVSLKTLTSNYYSLTTELETQRKYSEEAYTYYPVYANLIDYLSNMFCWRYTYIPRMVKDKGSDFKETYARMGEVVDGVGIETTFPMLIKNMLIDGAVYIITAKTTSSKTITTLKMPFKYCRVNSITQYGYATYQFDFSYFDNLGVTKEELEFLFTFFPPEMSEQYVAYKNDSQHMRWQELNPHFAAAFLRNEYGFPTSLYQMFAVKQYQQYLDNELERNEQTLDKIVAHKMPTWQDKLVVDVDEMAELHQSMSKIINKNKHTKLVTSFGDVSVQSVGEDTSKENKTLENANNTIFDSAGENHNLFSGSIAESLLFNQLRNKSLVKAIVDSISSFYNVVINNSFNFKGYQCDLTILPMTVYDEADMLKTYKEGATLGVTKLEYVVASGIKQVDLSSKIELEDFLGLDKLKPLSTSYTQNDNSKTQKEQTEEKTTKDEDNKVNKQTEETEDE